MNEASPMSMWSRRAALAASVVLFLFAPAMVRAQATCTETVAEYATFTTCTGTLSTGALYGIQIPTDWNGTLVLSSHGAVPLGPIVRFPIFIDALTRRWLLEHGYALAGSYSGPGWAVEPALRNQIETLDTFASTFGSPVRTIAYGGSMGGLVTAGLIERHPERFDGGLSFDAPLAGIVGTINSFLDVAFVVQQLLGPESGLQIARIADPVGNVAIAKQLLVEAQATPQGRARIALAAAMADVPGWFDPLTPEPAADDYEAQQYNQYRHLTELGALLHAFGFFRADLEARAAGNPAWNTGVNYERQLENSVSQQEVQALYAAAGLDLQEDLARLQAAPRIAADPAALEYATRNIVFDGDLGGVPFLALHNTASTLSNTHMSAYRSVVLDAMNVQLLRQAFMRRPLHALHTPAELIAAVQALVERIDTGKWEGSTSPEALNAAAAALGSFYNVLLELGRIPAPSAFVDYEPAAFLRPYDLNDAQTPALSGSPTPSDAGRSGSLARTLTAWPLPYRGGSLNVSFAAEAGLGTTGAAVAIFDLAGRRVRLLTRSPGSASLQWDGRDDQGKAVGNGMYFLRANDGRRTAGLKLAVMR